MRKMRTTYEVWKAIREAHPDLKVFGSYSAPDGDYYGNPDQGVMETSYGFELADVALMEARTKWDIDRDHPSNRLNEEHQYWLLAYRREEDFE